MTQEELRKVQMLQLEMAKEVKRICEKHQIQYFLDAGSMLGAVRHKGFIPWDDDLDIGFLREEYDRFLKIAPQELAGQYYIQNSNTDDDCGLTFSKIRLKGTRFVESISCQKDSAKEIYIDLFSYDNRNNDEKEAIKEAKKFRIFAHLLLIKCKTYVWKGQGLIKWLKFLPFRFWALFYTKKELRARIHRLTALHRQKNDSKNVFVHEGTSAHEWYFPKKILEDLIQIPFEGELFSVPRGYDAFLTKAYGNYMEIPSKEKRKTHHIIELDFGIYK